MSANACSARRRRAHKHDAKGTGHNGGKRGIKRRDKDGYAPGWVGANRGMDGAPPKKMVWKQWGFVGDASLAQSRPQKTIKNGASELSEIIVGQCAGGR